MITGHFVDPYTKEPLILDFNGNLRRQSDSSVVYPVDGGCFDFALSAGVQNSEREHYDKEHAKTIPAELDPDFTREPWFDDSAPWRRTLLESLGHIAGKRILLVGNGGSCRELYFANLGALVVYTDLSFETVKAVRDVFSRSELNSSGTAVLEFHAVDAMHLPFPSCSFDIIYGSAFVHHLEDTGPFFSEVHRCLKPNGICRFIDQADAPLWGWLKQTILRPAQLYSYWRYPRSPEDLKANRRGGFNEESLTGAMRKHNFKELFFVRNWFLHWIVWRHFGKAVGWKADAMQKAVPLFRITKGFDNLFSGMTWMRKNQLTLVWGFTK